MSRLGAAAHSGGARTATVQQYVLVASPFCSKLLKLSSSGECAWSLSHTQKGKPLMLVLLMPNCLKRLYRSARAAICMHNWWIWEPNVNDWVT